MKSPDTTAIPSTGLGWTETRVESLKTLWLDGFSASQVARELGGGLTRNAVIGKIFRLGLKRGEASAVSTRRERNPARDKAPPRPRMKVTPSPPARAERPPALRGTAPPADHEPTSRPPEAYEPPGLISGVMALNSRTCRWPIGDPKANTFSFCGCAATDVYCDRHKARAHNPRTPAMRKADRALDRRAGATNPTRSRPLQGG